MFYAILLNQIVIKKLKNQLSMKSIRKQASKISIFLALSLLFISCSQNESFNVPNTNGGSQNLKTNLYTGQDLFKGIFFSEGVVASRLSNYEKFNQIKSQFNKEERKKLVELQNDLIEYISKNNPTYFLTFEKSINSGNPVIIRNEIEKSKILLKEAVTKVTNINFNEVQESIDIEKAKGVVRLDKIKDLKMKLAPSNNYDSTNVVAVFPVWAVAIVVAVVVEVAVYVDVVYWSVQSAGNEGLRIENEDFINSITLLNNE